MNNCKRRVYPQGSFKACVEVKKLIRKIGDVEITLTFPRKCGCFTEDSLRQTIKEINQF